MAPLTGQHDSFAGLILDSLAKSWHLILPFGLALTAALFLAYRVALHPLAKFPGPLEARLSGSWRNRRFWRGTWHDDILEVHKRYGPVVRIAPNELSIVDEKATKQLYGHGTTAAKTEWYATWDDPLVGPGLFAARDKKLHSFLRKRVSAVYSMSAMLRYEEFIQSCLTLLMTRLQGLSDAGQNVNMSEWVDALAFDVVGELAYGAPLGHLETGQDVFAVRGIIHTVFFLLSNTGHYFGQSLWLTHPLIARFRTALGVPDLFMTFRDWTKARVVERQMSEGKAEREDMLHHFLNMKTADGAPADLTEVQIEAMNIVGAGADTTSIAMRACLYWLCKSPEIYKDLQNEIDNYYDSTQLQKPITYQQTQELPLLCATVREATRLWPSIVYPLLRHAPPGLEVDGKSIPPGTPVGMSAIAANRNPDVWGSDADIFRPSRWMESEEKTRYLNANDMTFGGNGARMCIGRNLALVEVHKFLAQFLRNFDAEFVDPERPWRVHSQWFASQHDMHMRLRHRTHGEKSF